MFIYVVCSCVDSHIGVQMGKWCGGQESRRRVCRAEVNQFVVSKSEIKMMCKEHEK